MILVTLGTGEYQFNRLMEVIQKQIDKGNIKDKVVVQAGHTKFESKDMEIFDLIPIEEFNKLMSECDLLITHGGVGSITTGLQNNKKIIAAARLEKYGEVANDHQLQIIKNFSDAGYIMSLDNFNDLGKVINQVKSFKPKKYKSNTNNMINILKDYIDNN